MRSLTSTSARLRRVAVVGVVLLASGAPLTAHAAAGSPAASVSSSSSSLSAASSVDGRVGVRTPSDRGAPAVASRIDPEVAEEIEVLVDVYEWREQGTRVAELQELLDVTVDGWYGPQTRRAHLDALTWLELPTAEVPMPPGPGASAWAALRECESGGDYGIASRSGKYRGAYQFDRSTWNSVASRHDPSLVGVDPAAAPPADQDAMARALHSERGARPWPHCGRHLT